MLDVASVGCIESMIYDWRINLLFIGFHFLRIRLYHLLLVTIVDRIVKSLLHSFCPCVSCTVLIHGSILLPTPSFMIGICIYYSYWNFLLAHLADSISIL